MRTRVIIGTTLALLLVAVMAFGALGSGAWFTSIKTTSSSSISAGTLAITVDAGPFTVSNLQPAEADGWVDVGLVHVKNTGTLPLMFQGYLTKTGGSNLDDVLLTRVVLNPQSSPGMTKQYGPAESQLFADELFWKLYATNNKLLDTETGAVPMDPGYECYYLLQVRLPETVGNTYQGASVSAKLTVVGHQVEWYKAYWKN